MASLLRKVARGELPGQRKSSTSNSRNRSGSGSLSGESSEDSPSRVIPPEPVQQALDGDFSLNDSERPLQVHNLARANKLCKALEWDNKLAHDAASYAKTLASTGLLERSGIEAQGENLYVGKDDASFEEAVDTWLDQEKSYDGKVIEGDSLEEWGYFSEPSYILCFEFALTIPPAQCVWRDTLHVGMGKAKSKDGKTYIVARYAPPGNVKGERPF